MKIHTIDLSFMGTKEAIASFLIENEGILALVETGPDSTFPHLKSEIEKMGYQISDIHHVFLTHIHFDHAGAAWRFAKEGAKIYVHPIGLPHLANPEKLWNSAQRIYGEEMDSLWGKMENINETQLTAVEDGSSINLGSIEVKCHYTPGHAIHHNAYQINDVVFTGDVAGIKIEDGPVAAPCPPPDIHLENWFHSIQKLRNLNPKGFYMTHFGYHNSPDQILDELEQDLKIISEEVYKYYKNDLSIDQALPLFENFVIQKLIEKGMNEKDAEAYEKANPSYMSVTGLYRYWKLKDQGRI